MLGSGIAMWQICCTTSCRIVVSSSVGGVVQHVRSRCPCSGVWHSQAARCGWPAVSMRDATFWPPPCMPNPLIFQHQHWHRWLRLPYPWMCTVRPKSVYRALLYEYVKLTILWRFVHSLSFLFCRRLLQQEAQLSLGWPTVLPSSRRSTQKLWCARIQNVTDDRRQTDRQTDDMLWQRRDRQYGRPKMTEPILMHSATITKFKLHHYTVSRVLLAVCKVEFCDGEKVVYAVLYL